MTKSPHLLRAQAYRLLAEAEELEDRLTAGRGSGHRTHFTQADGERPPWASSRLVFLRAWRELAAEGYPGVVASGKTRIMSVAASDDYLARSQPRRAPASIEGPRSLEDDVAAELGLVRKRGRR